MNADHPTLQALLSRNDLDFLRAIVARYPETELLAGKAEASPEGNPKLKPEALAYRVFPSPDETAIEADRTFLGLLLFKAAINGDRSYFPHLSDRSFAALRAFTNNHAATDEDREFLLYSLACNDLGKTQALVDQDIALHGTKADDHDRLMAGLVRDRSELFPGLARLTPAQQDMYRAGLDANFNLGQFVQGECLPADLAGMQALPDKARNLRLLAELFDFAGATGHVRADASILLNEDNWAAYHGAITELATQPLGQAYDRYIAKRASQLGLGGMAMGRIAAMARATTTEQGATLQAVWQSLPDATRAVLARELAERGSMERPGILLYYAPAVIANAVKASGDFAKGLRFALIAFAEQFTQARGMIRAGETRPVITVNVAELARDALSQAA